MSTQLSERIQKQLNKLLANTGDMALKRRAKNIIEGLNPHDGDNILDVGCGDGYYLFLLSNLGLKINLTGADFDKRALESAKLNLVDKKIQLVYGDLTKKLPFAGESFDKIVMSEVAEHLPNDVWGLKEVYRILKPGGVLCLTVPNANYPFFWDPVNWVLEHFFGTHIKSGFWAGIWNQHKRLYSQEQTRKIMEKAGFFVEETKSLTFWSLPFNHNMINLGARILAAKTGPKVIIQGANKFSKAMNKSAAIKLFFGISNFIDGLNNLWTPKYSGVGIFAIAIK